MVLYDRAIELKTNNFEDSVDDYLNRSNKPAPQIDDFNFPDDDTADEKYF